MVRSNKSIKRQARKRSNPYKGMYSAPVLNRKDLGSLSKLLEILKGAKNRRQQGNVAKNNLISAMRNLGTF